MGAAESRPTGEPMTTSTTGPERHFFHEATRALHLGLLLRVVSTTALILLIGCVIGAVVGIALTKVADLVIGIL